MTMMNKYGGIRKSIEDVDFKYIEDPIRIMWSKSVIKNVQKIVDFISTIPFDSFSYNGDIYYSIVKNTTVKEKSFNSKISIPEVEPIVLNYVKSNLAIPAGQKNIISYNFFGGTVFELLNDNYTNVNLYKYTDPTSDIDVLINTNNNIKTFVNNYKNLLEDIQHEEEDELYYYLIESKNTLVYENENGIVMINPFTKSIADFIYDNLLENLNRLNLFFENSVQFEDHEYELIEYRMRDSELGYKSTEIGNTNAKLISYFDEDFKTFRIQLVLKIKNETHQIIDHFVEFLIKEPQIFSKTKTELRKVIEDTTYTYNISSLVVLFYDNLDAYIKRQNLLIENKIDTRHKGLNHILRFIYLLDLIKQNPNIFYELTMNSTINSVNYDKRTIALNLNKTLLNSYIIYIYIDGKNIYKKIETKYIFKAFQSLILDFFKTSRLPTRSKELLSETTLTEEKMYNILSRFFDLNSSPFRRFIMNSKKNIKFDEIIDDQIVDGTNNNVQIEQYRDRINQLINAKNNATSDEEKTQLAKQIEELKLEFQNNLPPIVVNENENDTDNNTSGGKNNKSKKKYRNKLKTKKYKNTKKIRRIFKKNR